MELFFIWISKVDVETKSLIEERIRDELKASDLRLNNCHGGPVRVTLAFPEPSNHAFDGSLKCMCGSTLGEITGTTDGLYLSYAPFETT